MELTIETATTKLLDTLYEIEKQSFTQEAFSKREIAYMLEDYNGIALVAKADDVIAGFIIARIDVERGRMFGHILTLDVAPQFRRRGVAIRLLTELETLLSLKGAVECRLEVREDNAAAIDLYKKQGYLTVGRLRNYYGSAHGLYLRKNLNRSE
jgi:ribosomal-protein-alanine N-acetyltransferase